MRELNEYFYLLNYPPMPLRAVFIYLSMSNQPERSTLRSSQVERSGLVERHIPTLPLEQKSDNKKQK